jgi:SAM-dependent methyltransferase
MGTAADLRRWWARGRWWTGALGALSRAARRAPPHPFDREHGVDTDGLIYADPLASGHENDRHSAGYYATAPSLFRGAMALWRETLAGTGYTLEDYTLVDIGCGKGRVLMLATEFRFREIVGIELNPRLARVARKNLRKWTIRTRASSLVRGEIRIVEGDALAVPLPDGPVVLFYFNSFEREMAEMWLARLGEVARERATPLDLIYIHPEFDALVRQVPGVRAVADAEISFSAEDAAADAFQVAVDRCGVYRLGG